MMQAAIAAADLALPMLHPADAVLRSFFSTNRALGQRDRAFIAETVFSHPSKLELIDSAHAASYTVILHVLLIPEELAVQRVKHRVMAGGHDVPEDKIRQQYQRLWPLAVAAITRCDSATVFDNTARKGPRIVAQMSGGQLVGAPMWPAWAPPVRMTWIVVLGCSATSARR